MEKIFQILAVLALLMLAINYFIKGKERKFQEYSFSGRFIFPLSGDGYRDLLSVPMVARGAEMAAGAEVTQGATTVGAAVVADRENHLLFRGRTDRTLEVVDEATGVSVATIALEWGADAVLFDPLTRLIYCGSVEGVVTIIRQSGADVYRIVQRLAVPKDGTALSLDPHNGKVYLHVGAEVFVYGNT